MKNENLTKAVNKLCEDLTTTSQEAYPTLAKYNNYTAEAGRKFIKIIKQDNFNGDMSESVWGFINIGEFTKERKMANCVKSVTFKEGDVLMANGWRAPALNTPRGNLFDGYVINSRTMYGPAYASSNRTL